MTKDTRQHIAETIAANLLKIDAIKLDVANPFTWASGLRSPIYCDNRRILSFPGLRSLVANRLADMVRESYPGAELVAGVATGAIAIGVLVAERLGLPFVYVRSKPKSHGLGAQLEGAPEAGQKTVVVEDLISTAGSSISACKALEEHGLEVLGLIAVFTYGLPIAEQNLLAAGYNLTTLSNYNALLKVATQEQLIGAGELKELQQWREDPKAWAAKHES